MEEIDKFINSSFNWRKNRRCELSQAKVNQTNEFDRLKKNLDGFAEKTKKSRQIIEKNLSSIMSHKHIIHKAQDLDNEISLPITNTHHGEFLNFISNSMLFMNEVGETDKFNLENNFDESKFSTNVQMCNANIMKLIHKDNNVVDEVQTIMDNINIVKDYHISAIQEEFPLAESSFFDATLKQ